MTGEVNGFLDLVSQEMEIKGGEFRAMSSPLVFKETADNPLTDVVSKPIPATEACDQRVASTC